MRKWFPILLLLGCHHAGTGVGTARATLAQAELAWSSGFDASNGELAVTIAGGARYRGPFTQIRAILESNTLGTYFVGWSCPDWARDPWYGGLPARVAGVNSGRVVAQLESANGERLRCRLELRDPEAGMTGGALGECQTTSSPVSFAVALPVPQRP